MTGGATPERLNDKNRNLEKAVAQAMFPTPTASMVTMADMEQARYAGNKGGNRPSYQEAKAMWPTPCARDHFPAHKPEYIEAKRKQGHGMSNLNDAVAHPHMFATPQARDFRTGQQSRWENPERTRNLNDQIGGQLNPTWVEWLMGWPLGWTDCAASATAKFQEWRASHGISSDRH
jgi:hypothetical protein